MPKMQASVLPSGSSIQSSLKDGEYTIAIVGSEDNMSQCKYPCGFVKWHQGKEFNSIVPQITNQLRGYYGVDTVNFKSLPDELGEGKTFTVEVTNGS